MHFHLAASHDQSKSKHTLPLKESAQTTFKIIAKSTRNHHIPWLKALFPDVLSVGKELNDAEWFSMMLNNYHVVGKLSIHLTYFVSPHFFGNRSEIATTEAAEICRGRGSEISIPSRFSSRANEPWLPKVPLGSGADTPTSEGRGRSL